MALKANLLIDQGATFQTKLNVLNPNSTAINLAGYSAAAQIRKHYSSSNSISFDASLNAASGEVVLFLSANTSAHMMAGRYVYDVELTEVATGFTYRIIEGLVTISPNVTR